MLYLRSIYPETLELLKFLMTLPSLQRFNLVGGTALALQMGHRISIDLDFFTTEDYNREEIIKEIDLPFELIAESELFFGILVKGIKIDMQNLRFLSNTP